MLGRRNLIERIDRLEEMILDAQWGSRNMDSRLRVLEEKILKRDIKDYNKKAEPKREVGRPRKDAKRVDFAKK